MCPLYTLKWPPVLQERFCNLSPVIRWHAWTAPPRHYTENTEGVDDRTQGFLLSLYSCIPFQPLVVYVTTNWRCLSAVNKMEEMTDNILQRVVEQLEEDNQCALPAQIHLFLKIRLLRHDAMPCHVRSYGHLKQSQCNRWWRRLYGPLKWQKLSALPLDAELNPTCHLLALLGGYHILHVFRIRVKLRLFRKSQKI